MTGAPKRKGDGAERELVVSLRSLGLEVARAYGAGRPDDVGDLDGLPGVYAQVKYYADPWRAVREALDAGDERSEPWPTGFVRYPRRPLFVVCMRLEPWADMYRAATGG